MPAVATDDDVMPSQMASDDLMPPQLAPVSNPNDSTPSVDPLKLAQWRLDLANQVQRLTGLAMAEWAQQPRPQPGAADTSTSQQSLAIDPRSLGAASNFGVPVVNAQPPLNLGDQLRQAQIDRIMALAKTPDQSALAQRYATDLKTPALPTPSPLGVAVVSPFAYAGRMAKGLVEDAAEGWGGQNVYGAPFEDFAAAASSPTDFKTPLPLDQQIAEGQEELRAEGHPILAAGPDVSLGVARAVPKIAAVALAPATLPAQVGASGLLFGLDDDGNFSVKDAGLAMLMPGAGAVSRLVAGKAIAAGIKAGVPALSNPAVQSVLMKSGDQLAMNATMLAMQSPELAQLWQTDPDKFWQAVGATVGQNLAFTLLPHTGKADQTETAREEAPTAVSSETTPVPISPPAAPADAAATPAALADLQSILRGNQGNALLKPSTAGDATGSSSGDARSIAVTDDSNLSSGPSNRDTTETSAETPSDGVLPTNGGHVSDGGRTPVPSDPTPGYVPKPLPPGTPFNRVRSKVPLPGGGMNAKWLEASLGDLQAGLPGAPELVIVQSVKDLPQRQRGMVEADLEQGYRTSGIFDEGKAWLIADHLGSLDEARTTYLEEALGHAAMEPLVKPGEVDRLYDLIRRGAPQKAAEILRNYGHDVRTAAGRAAFVGEFVAKASEWYLEAPSLWRRIADVMRRLAYRVKWLRDIAPSQVLDATMRGLARKGIARLAANAELKNGPNRLSQGVSQSDDSTGPRFSRVRWPAGPDADNHFATTSNTAPSDADSLRPPVAPKRSGGGSTGGRPQGLSDLAPDRMPENGGPMQTDVRTPTGGPVQTGGRVQTPSEPNLAEAPTKQTKQSNLITDAGTTVPPASDFNLSRSDSEPASSPELASISAPAPRDGPVATDVSRTASSSPSQSDLTEHHALETVQQAVGLNRVQAARLAELQAKNNAPVPAPAPTAPEGADSPEASIAVEDSRPRFSLDNNPQAAKLAELQAKNGLISTNAAQASPNAPASGSQSSPSQW